MTLHKYGFQAFTVIKFQKTFSQRHTTHSCIYVLEECFK